MVLLQLAALNLDPALTSRIDPPVRVAVVDGVPFPRPDRDAGRILVEASRQK